MRQLINNCLLNNLNLKIMFKSSQEIQLNKNETSKSRHYAKNKNGDLCIFGRYHTTDDVDECCRNVPLVFVAPELTDVAKIELLHFPNGAVRTNSEQTFIVKRNGVKGNFEVKLESPSGRMTDVPIKIVDPERLQVLCTLIETGLYKIHIKCNSVLLPRSPFIIVAFSGDDGNDRQLKKDIIQHTALPSFESDAKKVLSRGIGLKRITLKEKNEFILDCSAAGNNILFVGIFGPKGQCDEVIIKHMEHNVYKIVYYVQDAGDYILAAKWGDEHIPGSPSLLKAS